MKPAAHPLAPGAWLGLLGGGQLGRMFCMAAQSIGFKVCVLDPAADGPSASVADRHIQADYTDEAALTELGELCAACTTEFENVPAAALEFLSDRSIVSPGAAAVSIAQDRMSEKRFAASCDLATAPWAPIESAADIDAADAALFPGILKVARLGYDGKGQARVHDAAEALAAFERFGKVPCVLEARLALKTELSVVVARSFTGETVAYPVAENEHRDGILAISKVPARIDPELALRATAATVKLAHSMSYVGVLCVEFRRRRRLAAGQRTGAAAAQLRPLHHRRLSDESVRAAGPGAGWLAARRRAAARAGRHAQYSGQLLVCRWRRRGG